ncbi:diaminopimelate decarboxylase [Mycoplasma sp. P36-A1]|uniref:diaminopimelate decarboxylase n=1 Tax=Mycoplasma sp. P36-A1 TaxID=3252900 RepID=UPI003C2AF600
MLKYKKQNNQLIIDGVNMVELANEYSTPLYVISYSKLKENINEFKESFQNKYENVRIHYASKANLSLGLAKIMQANDFGLDVVSGGELYIAKAAGVNLKNIEFNGNAKTQQDIEFAIKEEIGYIVCDNETELARIQDIAAVQNKVQNILFRVTPEVSGGAHKAINTGQKDSKFGIPITEDIFFEVFKKSLTLNNVCVKGIHFHVGSQLHDNETYIEAVEVAYKLLKKIKEETNVEIEVLNLGGGFGINYTKEDNAPGLSYYFDIIMKKVDEIFKRLEYKKRPKIVIEPGRYMIGEAGVTLYQVQSITEIPKVRKYIGLNGGMTDNIRPSMYQARYEAVVANKMDEEIIELVTLAGNCCESGDIIIENIKLPIIEPNDTICVFSTGAYGYSMASNYNKNRIPPTLLIENGKVQTLIKGQTFKQLIENDCEIEI